MAGTFRAFARPTILNPPPRDPHHKPNTARVRSCGDRNPFASKEAAMWTVHAAFRLGDYRTGEVDLTPALGVAAIVTVVLLMLQTA
jgi:hypothetical protein